MNDDERLRITKNTVEVLENLKSAITKAGGCVDLIRLSEMNMLEFISHVCVPNGVRFCYGEPKYTVDEDIIHKQLQCRYYNIPCRLGHKCEICKFYE